MNQSFLDWPFYSVFYTFFHLYRFQDATGFYAYIQARDQEEEDQAFLESDYFMASDNERCLNFYYHMNGDHIGRSVHTPV